jgi:phytanoyl-CoA dioxygenase PhyH
MVSLSTCLLSLTGLCRASPQGAAIENKRLASCLKWRSNRKHHSQGKKNREDGVDMDSCYSAIASDFSLPRESAEELDEHGFIVIQGAITRIQAAQLEAAYDAAVSSADPDDIRIGSTTTRVSDFVNRGPAFDSLYIHGPILAACATVIQGPFKLSTMHARAVHPCAPAQKLHVDFERQTDGWPMVGFIIMIDPFRETNGATRFVPGSHKWSRMPEDDIRSLHEEQQILATGPAGSIIIYNGSIWHGHSANETMRARRSIQGAYIRREAQAGVNQNALIRSETFRRITPLARYLLDVEE